MVASSESAEFFHGRYWGLLAALVGNALARYDSGFHHFHTVKGEAPIPHGQWLAVATKQWKVVNNWTIALVALGGLVSCVNSGLFDASAGAIGLSSGGVAMCYLWWRGALVKPQISSESSDETQTSEDPMEHHDYLIKAVNRLRSILLQAGAASDSRDQAASLVVPNVLNNFFAATVDGVYSARQAFKDDVANAIVVVSSVIGAGVIAGFNALVLSEGECWKASKVMEVDLAVLQGQLSTYGLERLAYLLASSFVLCFAVRGFVDLYIEKLRTGYGLYCASMIHAYCVFRALGHKADDISHEWIADITGTLELTGEFTQRTQAVRQAGSVPYPDMDFNARNKTQGCRYPQSLPELVAVMRSRPSNLYLTHRRTLMTTRRWAVGSAVIFAVLALLLALGLEQCA